MNPVTIINGLLTFGGSKSQLLPEYGRRNKIANLSISFNLNLLEKFYIRSYLI
jgi:hypothetical protein